MKLKLIIISTAIIGLAGVCQGQGKKTINKYKIKTVTETITDIGTSEKSYKDNFQRFDSNGNTIEDTEYKSDGTIKEKSLYKYDSDGNLLQEEKFDNVGFIERKTYTYNPEGEKITELIYDRANKLTKKTIYTYNNKGLKTEKKTFDVNGKILSIKKYIYEN